MFQANSPSASRKLAQAGSLLFRLLRLMLLAALVTGHAAADDDDWGRIRASLFADRQIIEQPGEVIQLTAPARAEDAATVPIVIRALPMANASVRVEKVFLVIDKNPSPLGATFTFAPEGGPIEVETRVRVQEYSMVRAIAQLSDGRLYMDSHFVKASGGCSAPASNDQSVEQLRLGRVKLRLLAPITYGQSAPAQLMIRHPNHSGLSKDQLTHLYIPARFIRYIDITYDGRPLINAEVDFTLSENPSLRFHFLPLGAGELRAVVTDSNDLIFQTTTTVREDAVRH